MTTQRGSLSTDALVSRVGTDTSGRAIIMTGWMHRCWRALVADPRLDQIRSRIVIVQGAFMTLAGGGAADSAGYHDRGGCLDCRSRDFTTAEIDLFILVASEYGFQFWRRDAAHGGMDPHLHCVFGSDYDLAPGAQSQVDELLETPRGDGLAGAIGRDYEHRVTPIRLGPPDELLQEDYMATSAAEQKLDLVLKGLEQSQKRDVALRKLVKALGDQLGAVGTAVALLPGATEDIKSRITKSKRELAELIASLDDEEA